jgi:hypothetical protein
MVVQRYILEGPSIVHRETTALNVQYGSDGKLFCIHSSLPFIAVKPQMTWVVCIYRLERRVQRCQGQETQ